MEFPVIDALTEPVRKVLIIHPDSSVAAGVGALVERSGVEWEFLHSLEYVNDGLSSGRWEAVFVDEQFFASLNLGDAGKLRSDLPETTVIVGIAASADAYSPSMFGAGVDLILYQPLALADIERALSFADSVNTESRWQARDRLRKMTALHELAVASGHRTGMPGWMNSLVQAGAEILEADGLAMWSLDRESNRLHCIGSTGLSAEYIRDAELRSSALLDAYEELPKELSTHWLTDTETQSPFRMVAPESARAIGIKRIAWLPVRDSRRLYGHLSFYFKSDESFETYDLVLADALASIVAAALGTYWLQAEIRLSNRLYREHVETSPNGVVVCHLDGTVERTNPAVEQITGHDQYELIGKSIFDWFLNPDELPWEDWTRLEAEDPGTSVEHWLVRKSGERRRVSCYARRVTFPDSRSLENTEQRIQLVFQDVTISARRMVELELFHDLTRLISGRGSLEDAYELVASRLYSYLNYRLVTVGEVDGSALTLRGYRNYRSELTAPLEFSVESGHCGLAVRENRSLLVQDVGESADYLEYDPHVVSEVVAVIRAEGVPVGLLDIQTDETQPLDDGDLQFAESIAAHLGLLIEQITVQERLEQQALTDPLTGVANRRAFIQELNSLTGSPETRSAALLLVELDNFKSINDRYGHLFGDEMLKQVTGRLMTQLREHDVVARYGGDEIAMVLYNTNGAQAGQVAERVRSLIADEPFTHNGSTTELTVSIGIALFPHHGRSTDELIAEADRTMYIAKLQGRNRIHSDIPVLD
jgi:diguanylate cyclase (GGDEF)-like protein/PAS domain S-box-containing protein